MADVVLPVQAYTEREGSLYIGRTTCTAFLAAVPEAAGSLPDFAVSRRNRSTIEFQPGGQPSGPGNEPNQPLQSDYAGLHYLQLSYVKEQWPIIGRSDLYYGGTTYDNRQGMGVQFAPSVKEGPNPS